MEEYLVLPSNSSFEYYPDNTLAHFRTRLAKEIRLDDGQWDVGMSEIIYSNTFYTFTRKDNVFLFYADGKPNPGPGEYPQGKHVKLTPGFYANKGELLRDMRHQLERMVEDLSQKLTIRWKRDTDQAIFTLSPGFRLWFSDRLCTLLSFNQPEREDYYWGPGTFSSEMGGDSDAIRNPTAMYVYCDLVRPRPLGDSMVPLLRVVPVRGEHGESVFQAFRHIQFVPVSRHHFHEVEIDIRDDTGKRIPFERGRVVVTLQFRKKTTI